MKQFTWMVVLVLMFACMLMPAFAGEVKSIERVRERVDKPKGKPSTVVSVRKKDKIGAFDKLWVSNVSIANGKTLTLVARPYDGTYTIAEVERTFNASGVDTDDTLGPILAALNASLDTAATQTAVPRIVTFNARDASDMVQLVAVFDTDDPKKPVIYTVKDVYDPANPAAFRTALEGIASWVAMEQGN